MRTARLSLLLLASSAVARAQPAPLSEPDPLAGQAPRRWIAPGGAYALVLPPGWNLLTDDRDGAAVELRPADGADAFLLIRRIPAAPGLHPRQLVLVALEQRLRQLPGFREGRRRDVRVAGSPGASVSGVYYHQGNAQFPRAVEEVFVVRGDEAFVFHFECFEPAAASLASAAERVYQSFVVRPTDRRGEGEAPAKAEGTIDTDRIPF